MLASFSNSVKAPETIREIAGLMILNRQTLVAHHFLQGYDVSVNLSQYTRDAFNAYPAIEPPALVNVISGDAEGSHGLHLILDQRRQYLFDLLPYATPLPLREFHTRTLRQVGVEDRLELHNERRIVKANVGLFA